MRLVSWNVNGIRAALKKDFVSWFEDAEADVVCLQEVKARQEQVDLEFAQGWHCFWNAAQKPGYSGVACFSKQEPLSVRYGMGVEEHDTEGRVIALEFEELWVVNCYTPNAQNGLARIEYRQRWDEAFREFLLELAESKPVCVGGDLNVAHEEIDLARPKSNHGSAGFSPQEREGMTEHLQAGFVDSFRLLYPDLEEAYSWWSYRGGARSRNVGWRIDYWLVSDVLSARVREAEIWAQDMGSDHAPVMLELG